MARALHCQKLASQFIAQRGTVGGIRRLHFAQGDFWWWDGGVYRRLPSRGYHCQDLNDRILQWMRGLWGRAGPLDDDPEPWAFSKLTFEWVCDNVQAILRTTSPGSMPRWIHPEDDDERNDVWIGFPNGVLSASSLRRGNPKFVRVNPRWFSTNIMPYVYEPAATCPLWEAAIREWLDGDLDTIKFVQEYIGYCMVPPHGKFPIALFLEGEGANGKTVFCETVEALVGPANRSAVPLEKFGHNFRLYDTLGCLINVCSEVDEKTTLPTHVIKKFVDQETITFDRKYHVGVTTRPTARLIISWNRRPSVTDTSHGFWRRVRVVPFRHRYREVDADPFFKFKLQRELQGIFNWAMRGYCRLMEAGWFTESEASVSVTTQFRRESDPLGTFLGNHVSVSEGGHVSKRTLYNEYCGWASDMGMEAVSVNAFTRAIRRKFPGASVVRLRDDNGKRCQYYTGVVLDKESL